jgi:BCD family chlorophyll transporter-like MFS transporter
MDERRTVGWFGIARMGLVQTALGAIVVLTTSTLNRVMVVELALPAMLPGLLVGWHYALQVLRPRWGFGSDRTGRRTPWILAGMAILASGGFLAAVATAWMATNLWAGIALGVVAFTLIGVGVGASGTSLLVLLSQSVPEGRRAAAATIVWVMMIMGFVVTAIVAGRFLDPYSPERLVAVTGAVSAIAMLVATLALWGLEGPARPRVVEPGGDAAFLETLRAVWDEPRARRFTIFVFVSMLAYATQDLILEPYAGTVFGMTPGQSTQLGGLQHAGVLIGMMFVGAAGTLRGGSRVEALQRFMIAGCVGSGLALALLAVAGSIGPDFPLKTTVVVLGVFNGAFAIAAIGAMMAMAGEGDKARHGTRMGLWGAAQAVAFGLGGLLGTVAVDVARAALPNPVDAYGAVFAFEALLFVASALLAVRVARDARDVAAISRSRSDPPLHPKAAAPR